MIPSLIFIRSDKKSRFALTMKKNLMMGSSENSDIIINCPYFNDREYVIGPNSPSGASSKRKKRAIPTLFSKYSFKTDGLTVYLVNFKAFLIFVLLGIAGFHFSDIPNASGSQDWTPIGLPAWSSYGYCRQDKKHINGVRFTFDVGKKTSQLLCFFMGGKGDGTSIRVTLNGIAINDSLSLPEGWSHQVSMPLPVEYLNTGENIIEVLPVNSPEKQPVWGISEVRTTPIGRYDTLTRNYSQYSPELVLNALKQPDISGELLSQYYNETILWLAETNTQDESLFRSTIIEQIEHKMKDLLYQVAFDIRSKRIVDNHVSVERLIEDTRNWIPESWGRGWQIYDEHIRQNE